MERDIKHYYFIIRGDAVASDISYRYVSYALEDIEAIASYNFENLYTGGAEAYNSVSGYNAILLAVPNQTMFTAIDVAVGFTVPTDNTTATQYVQFSGVTYYDQGASGYAFYFGDDQSGYTSGDDYVRFGYHYPEWDITYKGVLDNVTTDNTTVDIKFTGDNNQPIATVNDNDDLAVPTATPDAIAGYTLATGTVWYTDEALTKAATFPMTITADTTLYGKYDEKSYTVTYAYESFTGAPANTTATVYWTDALGTLPTEATRTGYTFDGWYVGDVEVSADTVYNTLDSEGTGKVTLTAKYDATDYKVSYDINGGVVTDTIATQTYAWDAAFVLPTTEPTRTGYTFAGWYTAKTDGTKAVGADTYGETVFKDVNVTETTLYAIWRENTYEITFNLDGGKTAEGGNTSVDSITVSWTGAFTGLPALPEKDGYTCDGWFYIVDGTATEVFSTDTYKNRIKDATATTVELKAVWIANTYKLTFDDQDGDATTLNTVHDIKYDATVTTLPSAPSRDGYEFKGWYTQVNGAGTKVETTTEYSTIATTAGDATVYADWDAIEYTITFAYYTDEGDIGTIPAQMTGVTWDDTSFSLASPTVNKSGWQFLHWDYVDTDGAVHHPITVEAGDTYGATIGALTSNTNITLYAHYAESSYAMTFVSDVTEFSKSSFSIAWDDALVLDEVSIAGYTFNGWYSDSGYTKEVTSGTVLKAIFTDTDDDDETGFTIYAKYTKNIYNIEFDENDGATVTDLTNLAWDTAVASITLPTTTKDGSTFVAWYEDEACTKHPVTVTTDFATTFGSDFGIAGEGETAHVYTGTLYAKWSDTSYKVHYNLNSGSGTIPDTQTLGWSGTLTDPGSTNFAKAGYTFKGWGTTAAATADNAITFGLYSSVYSGDDTTTEQTLYAIWEVNSYTVTYDVGSSTDKVVDAEDNDGVGDTNEIEVAYNATFTLTTLKPAVTGKSFDAWYKTSDFTGKITTGGTYSELFGAADATLYAKYTDNKYTITFTNLGVTDVVETGLWTDDVTVPTPSKTGYDFYSWENAIGTEITIASDAIFADVLKADSVASMTLTAYWQELEPSAIVDYSNELLTGLTADADYTITVDGHDYSVTADEKGQIKLALSDDDDATTDYDWFGHTICIVKDADGDYTVDSEPQSITLVARPADPYSSLSSNTASTAYDGAQFFTLKCDTANTYIHYDIDEHDGYELVSGIYNPDSKYAIKENSNLELYAVIADGETGGGLKSATVNYVYYIAPNLSVDVGDFSSSGTIIDSVGGTAYDTLLTGATAQDFGLIKIDDSVTDGEEEILLGAVPVGYSEEVEFHLHATIDDEIIYSTVTLATEVTVDIVLDDYASNKTYQVLHMKHDGTSVADVEIFSEELGNLIVLPESKTLRISELDSLSPFVVVSKTNSSSNFKLKSDTVSDALETFEHVAYMQGYADGTFAPNASITRAQATVMFSRLLTEQMDLSKQYTSTFSDVSDEMWYADAVGYMEKLGIINGYADGTFRGDAPISRAEFAVIACRFQDMDLVGTNPFSDVADDHWAVEEIATASTQGWILGYNDGTFRPGQNITRAESVTIVNRMLGRLCDMDFVEDHLDDVTTFTDVSQDYWAYEQILEAANTHAYTTSDGKENWTAVK